MRTGPQVRTPHRHAIRGSRLARSGAPSPRRPRDVPPEGTDPAPGPTGRGRLPRARAQRVKRIMTTPSEPLHLAVALDGTGWHPAAWREPDARPAELFTAGYWVGLVAEAERGLLDFVTIEDSLSLQSSSPFDPDEPHRPGPRPARRRAHRIPGGAAYTPHRARPDRRGDAHRAVPHLEGHRHARLRQLRPGRGPCPGIRRARMTRRTSDAGRSGSPTSRIRLTRRPAN